MLFNDSIEIKLTKSKAEDHKPWYPVLVYFKQFDSHIKVQIRYKTKNVSRDDISYGLNMIKCYVQE